MVERASLTDSPLARRDVAALIKGRRTVDRFRAGDVPDIGLVREAIDVARWAPNHHLTEPWRFALIGPAAKAAIIELNTRLLTDTRGAEAAAAKRDRWQGIPGWLAVTCQTSHDTVRAAEDHAACACAIQNLVLYLHSAGVASKWASGAVTREAEFLRIIGAVPDAEYCMGLIWYGYPARRPKSQRQPLADIVRERD